MKITDIKPFPVHPGKGKNLCFVKIETDQGIHGWGACYTQAEPYFVVVSPHNYNSTALGLAATVQVAAAIPNFLITEYFVNLEAFSQDVATTPFKMENGYVKLTDAPGLGLDIDEQALARYPYQPFPARSQRQYYQEGP